MKEADAYQRQMDFLLEITKDSVLPDMGKNRTEGENAFFVNTPDVNGENIELYLKAARERVVTNMLRRCSESMISGLESK